MRPGMSGLGRCALLAVVALAGCGDTDPIRQYTVAKQAPDEETVIAPPSKPTTRQQPEQRREAWFFKLVGPESAVAAQVEPFAKLVQSVHFGPDGNLTWTLPDGWTE